MVLPYVFRHSHCQLEYIYVHTGKVKTLHAIDAAGGMKVTWIVRHVHSLFICDGTVSNLLKSRVLL